MIMTYLITAKIHGKTYVAMDCQGSFSNCPEDGMIFCAKEVAESYVGRVEASLENAMPDIPASVHVMGAREVLRAQPSNI